MSKFDDYLKEQISMQAITLSQSASRLALAKEEYVAFWAACESVELEAEGAYIIIHEQPNFDLAERLLEALLERGFNADDINSKDYPEARNRDFHVNGKYQTFTIYYYLAQDAECELVEVAREPQPDKITYRLDCRKGAEHAQA